MQEVTIIKHQEDIYAMQKWKQLIEEEKRVLYLTLQNYEYEHLMWLHWEDFQKQLKYIFKKHI